jgi:hypothetical protein
VEQQSRQRLLRLPQQESPRHLVRARREAGRHRSIARLVHERLTIHEAQAQVLPTHCSIPWLGFVLYPTHRLIKRRNAVNFTRRLEINLDGYRAGQISFAELDASVQGSINHVRYADSWGLGEHVFATHSIPSTA